MSVDPTVKGAIALAVTKTLLAPALRAKEEADNRYHKEKWTLIYALKQQGLKPPGNDCGCGDCWDAHIEGGM